MEIKYQSTRGDGREVTASQAILQGLSRDGGLFVPNQIPALDLDLAKLPEMTYQETAYEVMSKFFSDFTEEELRDCIAKAYDDKFDTAQIAPLTEAGNACYLELYHGATIAFKDMALSILPHLMTTAAKKNNADKKIVILAATSGDTGKAAMAGFADVPGTEIIVFYPKHGVSPIQEKQMLTQKGANTHVVGILGNFDDAQSAVKGMFNDRVLAEELSQAGYQFSSANSINIGRLVPQIVYYVYAYGQMVKLGKVKAGEPVNFVVPTGNFGNILAAYYSKLMGLPVHKLLCASNENKVLFDFFQTGAYDRNRDFILTNSPSMDILISSNLERLIYRICGNDAKECARLMSELSANGLYRISEKQREGLADFYGDFCSEGETKEAISAVYYGTDYLLDTHTAVAAGVYQKYVKKTEDLTPTVIVSTASPYKFPRSVMEAVNREKYQDLTDFELVDEMAKISGRPVPQAVEELRTAPVLHDRVVEAAAMEQAVKEILGDFQMIWKELLSPKRAGSYQSAARRGNDLRSEFEKDYHRIIGSSAFRRLQDKTQVFPLDKSDFIRTRLTHSLEVSSFAKSLGQNIAQYLLQNQIDPAFTLETKADICDILQCAGLIHDIGNPPFGHFGEEAIRDWFVRKLPGLAYKGKPVTEVLSPQMLEDFYHFEGNAQALRQVSKLHFLVNEKGMNLTYGLLNTIIKYPVSSLEIRPDSGNIREKKMGYFYAERELFADISRSTGTKGAAPSLTYILEAADDIAYRTADIEDAFKKGCFSYDTLLAEMERRQEQAGGEAAHLDAVGMLKHQYQNALERGVKNPRLYAVQNWVVRLQSSLIFCATYGFTSHYRAIMSGVYRQDLFAGTYGEWVMKALGEIAYQYAFISRPILELEIAAGSILNFFLDRMVPSVLYYDTDQPMGMLEQKMTELISDNYKQTYHAYSRDKSEEEKLYLRLLLVTDFVSGMTDSYAKDFYQKLNGIS